MTLGLLFWVLYVISIAVGGWYWRAQPWFPFGGIFWVLVGILGWAVFGPVVR